MIADIPYVVAQAPQSCPTMTMTKAVEVAGSPVKFFEGNDAKRLIKAYFQINGIDDGMERPETGVSIHIRGNAVLMIGWVNECAVGAGRITIEELEQMIAIVAGRGV